MASSPSDLPWFLRIPSRYLSLSLSAPTHSLDGHQAHPTHCPSRDLEVWVSLSSRLHSCSYHIIFHALHELLCLVIISLDSHFHSHQPISSLASSVTGPLTVIHLAWQDAMLRDCQLSTKVCSPP